MLTRWSAFDETFRTLDFLQRQIDQAFDGAAVPSGRAPAVDVRERDDAFELVAEVPGMTEQDLSLVVENDTVVLSGERKLDPPAGYRAHVRERAPVRFSRKFTVPARIDATAVTASLSNGVLTVTLPKAAEARARKIQIGVGAST